MGEKLRKTGITVLGDVPWGTHLCLFYQTKEDLIDILVPYFKAGLENNELCMWVTSEPLKVDEAKTALKKAVKNLDNYIKKGQIEILDASRWYTKTGKFKAAKVLEGWVAKEKQALERGFDGLRLTGNTFWLEKRDWKNFTNYEKEVNNVIHKHHMIALCSYSLDKCGASEIIDVVDNHQSALIERRGKWELLERGKCKRTEEALKEAEENFRNLAEQSSNMIFINKKGRVVYANQKCEEIMGYKKDEFYSPDFNFLTLMTPEFLDLAKASFSKHIKGEDVAPHEYTLITKKGKRVTAIITTKLIQYNGDNAILGILIDITERKQTEEALKTSEALYRDLVEKAGIGIIIEDKDGNLKYFNEKFAELFGYSVAEIKKLSDPNQALVYPADNEKILKIWKKRIQGKRVPSRYEFRGIRKDGTIRYFEIDVVNLNAEGKYSGIRAYIRDITERKQAVEALKISEENYKTIFENLPFVGLTFDRKGRLLEANKRAEEVTGLSLKDFKGKSFSKFGLLGKKDLFIAFTEFRKNSQGKVTDGTVYHPKLKDGREILLELVGIPIKENGEVKSVLVVGDDVTERKRAVEALKVSEQKYKSLVKNLSVGVYRNTPGPKGKFIEVNPAIVKMFGYDSREEFLKLNVSQLYQNPGARKEFNKKMKKDGLVKNTEIKLKRKDGTLFLGSVTAVAIRDGKGKINHYDGIVEDITEQKRAAKELKYMHKIYRKTIENAQGVPYRLNYADNTYEFIGEGCEELLGIPPKELTFEKLRNMVKQIVVTDPKAPSDPFKYGRAFRRGKVKRYQADLQIVTPSGDSKWVSDCSVPILDEKKEEVIGSLGILQDITERKQAQEALQESEEKYRTQFEEALDAIFVADAETGIIIDCNRAASKLVGREKSELVGKHQRILHPPEEIEGKFSRTFKQHLKEKEGQVLEAQVITKKGAIKDVAIKGSIFELKGEKLIQGTFRDITERKKAEEELIRLSSAVRISTDSIVISDLEGKIIDVNEATLKMYGAADKRDLIGKNSFDLIAPEDRGRALEGMKEVLESGYIKNREYHIIIKDGSRLPVEMNVALMKDATGKPTGFVGISRDITERKQAEKALAESEHEKAVILDSLSEIVIYHDKELRVIWANRAASASAGVLPGQLKGRYCYEIWQQCSKPCKGCPVLKALKTGRPQRAEITASGRLWLARAHPIRDANGEVIGAVEVTRDVTERKQAEEKIKASLKEKEALLKEIHHRVKNNMQVISSLLSLQSKQTEDKQLLEMFRDSQNRVKSMALIHEKLYGSKDLARIDFAEYVQSLASHLFNSYGIDRAIELETNIKDVLLDINTAIPCGLIINELVSNSLKHAFPNGNEGPSRTEGRENKISISITSDKKDKYTLTVSDNGVGFPKDLASRIQDTNTLGLKLVNTLVEQLDGSIELGNSLPSDSGRENGGSVFKVTFGKPKYAKKS